MKRKHSLLLTSVVAVCFVSPAHGQLLGLWRFDGDALDSSLNNNHGSLVDGASLSGDTPSGAGQSLSLAGGTQHVLVPHHESLDVDSAISITAWVKTVGDVEWDGVLAKNPSDGSDANHAGNYELRIENGTRGTHFLYQQGGANDTAFHLNNDATIADSTWTHVAVTAEAGGEVNYYLDGVFAGTHPDPVSQNFGATNTNPLYIGSRADLFTTMDGFLDDVAIFDSVLTEGQIQLISTGDFSAFLEPASADFNMDGVVDEKDFFILSDHMYGHIEGPVAPSDGDFNRDGFVDLVDFGMFKTEFPLVVEQALASVPEPSTLSLLLLAILSLMGFSRRRRS